MNHIDVEERQIAERYLMGKLPPEEAAGFEEHYLSCQECLDRLELAESMERGFKRAAGQDAARAAATRQIAIVAWLSRLGRSRQMAALAMGVLVIAVLPGLLGLREVRERERELSEARSALEQERLRSAAGSRSAADVSEAEKRLRQEMEAALEREEQARASAEEQLEAARRPQENVPILFLNPERGGEEPTHHVKLPRTPGWIVLALEVDEEHPPPYRAVLRDAKGKEIWSGGGLRLNENDALAVSLPSTLLAPGDYAVEVDGARFIFRVLP